MIESSMVNQRRRSIRLKDWDYSGDAAYFVTVCTLNHEFLFGDIVKDEMQLNRMGEIAAECWCGIPNHFPNISLGSFVIMPNHVHGILCSMRAQRVAPLRQPSNVIPESLGAVMRSFKGAVTKRIRMMPDARTTPIWQRNYHEHIIRDEAEMQTIHDYIEANPGRWNEDEENIR